MKRIVLRHAGRVWVGSRPGQEEFGQTALQLLSSYGLRLNKPARRALA